MGRIAICLTVSLNFNCCREGVGERRGIGGWGRGRGAAYWRCMQRTLKLLIAFGRQPQRRVVLLSPHTVRLVFPPLPSCCVPLFGSAATPTVCLVLLSLSFFCSCMKMSCIHTLTHTHSRHLVLSHKMCDVYLRLRPTRLCWSTCALAVSLYSLTTYCYLPPSLSTVCARYSKHTCSTTFVTETVSRQIFALNMP